MKRAGIMMILFSIILCVSAWNASLSGGRFLDIAAAGAVDKPGAGTATSEGSGNKSVKIWVQPTEYFTTEPFVTLETFTATLSPDGSKIIVEWETSSEVHNVGFYVLRSDKEHGEYVKLNDEIISTEVHDSGVGSDSYGAVYIYEDTDFQPDTSYWYKLEAVDLWRQAYIHGPVHLGGGDADSDGDTCFISTLRHSR
jgi:hypothetical protein